MNSIEKSGYKIYKTERDVEYMTMNGLHNYGYTEPPTDYHEIENRKRKQLDNDNEEDEESIDSGGHKKSLNRLMVRFAEKTSMVGVGYINAARFWYSKAIWTFLLLVAIGWMGAHLYYLISQYTQWPKQTKISLGFSSLTFPAVTVCNTNVIRVSKLHMASAKLQGLVHFVDPSRLKPEDNIPATQVPQGKRRKKRFVRNLKDTNFDNFTDVDRDYDDDSSLGDKDDLYELEDTFRQLFLEEDRHTRVEMGHQIENMLISCSFNGYKCYPENFTLINTEDYGNCFTIQSRQFQSKDAGPKKGLSMIFYTENNEYLTGINQGYGMRLLVHNQDTFPMPAEYGIYISSAFETNIGLKMTNITRASKPYGDCEEGTNFQRIYKLKYSRATCQLMCEQTTMLKICGCFSDNNKEFFYYIGDSRKNSWCKTRADFTCIARIKQEFDTQKRTCSCENPCNEVQYTLSQSNRQWPTTEYTNTLLTGLCEQFPYECQRVFNLKSDPRELSANFLKVTIYYEDLNYEELTEEPEIAFAQFISDVGGSVGLWIGLSILSLFEVFQLFIELCAYAGNRCRKIGSDKKNEKASYDEKDRKGQLNRDTHIMDYNHTYKTNWDNRF